MKMSHFVEETGNRSKPEIQQIYIHWELSKILCFNVSLTSIQMHTHQFQLKSHIITMAINITIQKKMLVFKQGWGASTLHRHTHRSQMLHSHRKIDKKFTWLYNTNIMCLWKLAFKECGNVLVREKWFGQIGFFN